MEIYWLLQENTIQISGNKDVKYWINQKSIQMKYSYMKKCVLMVIKDCRTENVPKFRERLRLNTHDVINTKNKQTVLGVIIVSFQGENKET